MPTLSDLLVSAVDLPPPDVEWLHLLVGDWQLLSDLSFADLVLWVPLREGQEWLVVAQCRPSTGPTAFHDDLVGKITTAAANPLVTTAWRERRPVRDRDPHWNDDVPVRQEAIPVERRGKLLGVLSRHTNLGATRTPSRLELTYLQCADDLARMVADGEFPAKEDGTGPRRGAPRVGDGLIRLDAQGCVAYGTPNATSALHRAGYVGDITGQSLADILTPVIVVPSGAGTASADGVADRVDESLPLVLAGRVPWRSDIEAHGAALSLRAIPLTRGGRRIASVVLIRDVTELRRRERELLSKDATIREVHHRVKNNLQTVAALLRLQARRLSSPDGQSALHEAMRRVSTIAMVHEILSEGLGERVDFDQVVDRTVSLAVELARSATASGTVTVRREGTFDQLEAANATPLALVLTELVANAVEHGLAGGGGQVTVVALRQGRALRIVVRDDGQGLPEGFQPGADGLGTQIVQALVGGEMRGRISWHPVVGGGTEVVVDVALRPGGQSGEGHGRSVQGRGQQSGAVSPDTVNPAPINPAPINPDTINPASISPAPISPAPISPDTTTAAPGSP